MSTANAARRRQRLAAAVGGSGVLSCDLLYQTEKVRDALTIEAVKSLDLANCLVSSPGADD